MKVTGTVVDAATCEGIAGASIEIWHESPDGTYRDRYRSVLSADSSGHFSYSGPRLKVSSEGMPHVHLLGKALGFEPGTVTINMVASNEGQKVDVLIALRPEWGAPSQA